MELRWDGLNWSIFEELYTQQKMAQFKIQRGRESITAKDWWIRLAEKCRNGLVWASIQL